MCVCDGGVCVHVDGFKHTSLQVCMHALAHVCAGCVCVCVHVCVCVCLIYPSHQQPVE